jgi:glycosyltransferase involved in cell wall biosynthesis
MRVSIVTDDLGGGTGNHLLALRQEWVARGLTIDLLCFGRVEARQPLDESITIAPAQTHFKTYPIAQIRRFVEARRYVRRIRPTVLHSYFFWPIMYGRLLKKLGLVPCLVENREDAGFNWGTHEYSLLNATRNIPDRVVCVSDSVREVVLERERLDPARVSVIRNGIVVPPVLPELRAATRAEYGMTPEQPVVGIVANLNRAVKGVAYFVDAVPLILAAVPATRFLVVGGGEQEETLRTRASDLGVADSVIFTGYRDDVDRLYSAMDVSTLTSLSEGLSITLLESMARGLPVVATSVGGNPELVVHEKTGFLVPPADVDAFARSVIAVLQSPQRRTEMGLAGRQRVEKEFRLGRVAAQYLQMYEELTLEHTQYTSDTSGL